MTKDWKSIYEKDLCKLDGKDLNWFIQEIKNYRLNETNCHSLSASECNTLLALAHSEQNSRASSKLARLAIWISVASFVASAIFSLINQLTSSAS